MGKDKGDKNKQKDKKDKDKKDKKDKQYKYKNKTGAPVGNQYGQPYNRNAPYQPPNNAGNDAQLFNQASGIIFISKRYHRFSYSLEIFRRHDQSRDGKLDINEFAKLAQEIRFPGDRMSLISAIFLPPYFLLY